MQKNIQSEPPSVGTGVPYLDEILGGGLTSNRVYLLEGDPGTGKSTLALQFLLEGVRQGERGLYITLSETNAELTAIAASHGWSLEGIDLFELVDPGESLETERQYRMFEPSEVELGSTIRRILAEVEQIAPKRVAFDSLSEMRLLAQDPLRYRRQILALKQYFVRRDCTVLMLDDRTSREQDQQLQSVAHGVIHLDHVLSEYGNERRRLQVIKFRGREYQGGKHDFHIVRGGIRLFPRESVTTPWVTAPNGKIRSGNESLDQLLGEGLSAGTSTLLLGPSGVGKSSCATLYAVAAARRGERSVFFIFDESQQTLIARSEGLGMELKEHIDAGTIVVHQLNPGELMPGEFAHRVRESVKSQQHQAPTTVVVIDSLNGYLNAMPHERYLIVQMHELLKYLSQCNVVTFLVAAQHGMLGTAMSSTVDTSYLADTVILFRYFEADGEIRQAISVVKKRTGEHERTIREFRMRHGQISVGPPLANFHGILTGTPSYTGHVKDLLGHADE